MEKYIYDEHNGLHYTQQGDYYLPDLTLPAENKKFIGIWGQRHMRYLKANHRIRYYNLLTSGKLNEHLADIEEQAQKMFFLLADEMAKREGVTEQLKAEKPMEWIGRMNAVKQTATEMVNSEIIYA